MKIIPGDVIIYRTVFSNRMDRVKAKTREGRVLDLHKHHITVDLGGYKDTINKYDVTTGKVVIKIKREDGSNMAKRITNITKEQLFEECMNLGTGIETQRAVALKYGLEQVQVKRMIDNWGIRDMIRDAGGKTTGRGRKGNGNQKPDPAVEKIHEMVDELQTVCSTPQQLPEIEVKNTTYTKICRPEKFKLKPASLLSQTVPQIKRYDLLSEVLSIQYTVNSVPYENTVTLDIPWEHLSDFIDDLRELQALAGDTSDAK